MATSCLLDITTSASCAQRIHDGCASDQKNFFRLLRCKPLHYGHTSDSTIVATDGSGIEIHNNKTDVVNVSDIPASGIRQQVRHVARPSSLLGKLFDFDLGNGFRVHFHVSLDVG